MSIHIRLLNESDPVVISQAFQEQGWAKSAEQYIQYLAEQQNGERVTLVAELNGVFAGYVNVLWNSCYPSFREQGIPEINDFNVLIKYQRQGIGSRLMDRAEEVVRERTDTAGIGVGCSPIMAKLKFYMPVVDISRTVRAFTSMIVILSGAMKRSSMTMWCCI
ncbi:GNAT family N-acetyltransferase [Paenibacillus sp. 1A_MP2]|uniref:GNAT family N-acetyltransferase n=1 Tax=Paenibacillus sp. 1A_MP2 TaxID=3457495 RepID=UPI003FCCEED2